MKAEYIVNDTMKPIPCKVHPPTMISRARLESRSADIMPA